jgi:class 3 adenylate cyclase
VQELPAGTVTFLFSDIEGSTRVLQRLGERWGEVVSDHNRIMRAAFAATGGTEVDRQGDSFFAVFARARHALAAAAQAQQELAAHGWPDGIDLRVRMGIHTGEPGLHDEGYLGLDVVRAARISAAAHGGQVLVSETTAALVRGDRLEALELRELGEHRLKDLERPERLFQLVVPGLPQEFTDPSTAPVGVPDVRRASPADWEAHPEALTAQALEAVRQMNLGPLRQLGPRIERQVQDALERASVGQRPQVVKDVRAATELVNQFPGGIPGAFRLAGVALAGVVLVLALVVVLILKFL